MSAVARKRGGRNYRARRKSTSGRRPLRPLDQARPGLLACRLRLAAAIERNRVVAGALRLAHFAHAASGQPSVPDDACGWRVRPCDRRRGPHRSSTHGPCPSDARPCRPCWQSHAAWPDPSTQIRGLPWPLWFLLPSRPRGQLLSRLGSLPCRASPSSATAVPRNRRKLLIRLEIWTGSWRGNVMKPLPLQGSHLPLWSAQPRDSEPGRPGNAQFGHSSS